MPSEKSAHFYVYRYQILPTSQTFQMSHDLPYTTLAELLADKNRLFANAVAGIREFTYSRTPTIHRLLVRNADGLALQLAVNRSILLSTPQFTEEEIANWPRVLVVFWNDPAQQKVFIQRNPKAFGHPSTIISVIEENLTRVLRPYQLQTYFEPLFEKNDFWVVVNKYPTQLLQVTFELISPNLANISAKLNLDLGELHRKTNTKRTVLDLNADKNGSLTINPDDSFIESLVAYASEGGGNITLKIRGVKKKVHTSKSVSEIVIDELEIATQSEHEIQEIIGRLLK